MTGPDPLVHFFDAKANAWDGIYTRRKPALLQAWDMLTRQNLKARFEFAVDRLGDVKGKRFLDVGCGPGHYSVEIASRGAAEVVGLDFSSTMLELGRRLAAHRTVDDRCTFVEGDLFNYVSAVPFDTVVAMGFFDYVSDAVRTLRHLRSMTEGRVLASFPWRYALRVPARKTWFKIRGCRFWTYTRVEIASACATVGVPGHRALSPWPHLSSCRGGDISVERTPVKRESDVLVLGAGLTGMAAASLLDDRTVVLERDECPGGLVKTPCWNGYWFDQVLHLLYFWDDDTERRITALLGDDLARCPPVAWVETDKGTVLFPFQMHLAGLDKETVARCITDLARLTFGATNEEPKNFEEVLQLTFGGGMCETFLLPYNRKMWKRPLDTLAAAGFTWNITRPDFDNVLRGALETDSGYESYNAKGWYPRPASDSPVRGMEFLAQKLAASVENIRLGHVIERIELSSRTVHVRTEDGPEVYAYGEACLATLPLPTMLRLCVETPKELLVACQQLTHNRVLSVALSVRGPRPKRCGHWRYYADESLCFTRLIYMHEFDPELAPPDGWGVLAEITERAEDPLRTREEILKRACDDVIRAGALSGECKIIDRNLMVIDPAYVVFTPENESIVNAARDFLVQHGVTPLGRYGRWEYSSMAQCMRDGFAWGKEMAERLGAGAGISAHEE